MTPWIAQQAVAGISALDANENGRRAVVTMYREAFAGVDGLDVPAVVMDGEAQPLLRFPLFARDTEAAERIIAAARQAGGYAERWYRPELFPGVTDPAAYGSTRWTAPPCRSATVWSPPRYACPPNWVKTRFAASSTPSAPPSDHRHV